MMDMLLTCLSEEAIDLPSPFLVAELSNLERRGEVKKAVAAYGFHDDRVMSIGFPLYSLHQHKMPKDQFARKRVEYAQGLEEEGRAYPIWTPPQIALSSDVAHAVSRPNSRGRLHLERAINRRIPERYR